VQHGEREVEAQEGRVVQMGQEHTQNPLVARPIHDDLNVMNRVLSCYSPCLASVPPSFLPASSDFLCSFGPAVTPQAATRPPSARVAMSNRTFNTA